MSIKKILIWLPSPLGDAVMATPALRSIRERFLDAKIYFCANKVVAGVLNPTSFADDWIVLKKNNPFAVAAELKKHNFDAAILFKNSLASAIAVFIAAIKIRIGYAREGRRWLLNGKLKPEKLSIFKYKPVSVIEYYLAIADTLDGETSNKKLQLEVAKDACKAVDEKFANYLVRTKPVIIIVPGGAFGPSKIWPAERFAAVIDFLVEKFSANVFISASPNEKPIAEKICSLAKYPAINLANIPIPLGQLKALFKFSDLVISNDTGPRHIAIALGKKIITLFGPNDPKWTQSDYSDEIKIVADVPCAPCNMAVCKRDKHYCMLSITAEMVCREAEKILLGQGK